ncbi:MAG: hypothetical protein ACYCTE_06800 [Acidimicrobiales bacterium]
MSNSRRYRRRVGRTLFVLPEIPDDASVAFKNALTIRNQATRTGRCPACGAVTEVVQPPRPGEVGHARMEHDDDCPALLGGDR